MKPTTTTSTSTPKAKILVGTPAYGGMCCVSYTSSLIQTIKHCASVGIDVEPCFLANESLIPRGRNTIVAKFMNDPTYTHLLFVDADINWSPTSVPRLVAHDKDIVGALYPKKGYDWQKLIKNKEVLKVLNTAAEENRELTEIELGHVRTKLLSFVANLRQKESKIQNGLVSLLHIGTGFMMIKRSTLEKMMERYPDRKHDDDIGALSASENKYLYALFDCEIHQLSAKKHYLSEDYLFCKRWTDMGGEIFADISVSLTHTGSHSFAGNFAVANNLTRLPSEPAKTSSTAAPEETTRKTNTATTATATATETATATNTATTNTATTAMNAATNTAMNAATNPATNTATTTNTAKNTATTTTNTATPSLKIERVPLDTEAQKGVPVPLVGGIDSASTVTPAEPPKQRLPPSQLSQIKIV